MRTAFKTAAILALILIVSSCKNKLNILAPYKEAVSVYGILCPQDQVQMIRINKVYLGEGNAYDMAQVSDSVNYKTGVLRVSLERYINNVMQPTTQGNTKTEILLRDSVVQLATGVFNTNQHIFCTYDKLFTSGNYKLVIKNTQTGNIFTATTNIIDSLNPTTTNLAPMAGPYYPVGYSPSNPTSYYVDYSSPLTQRKLRFYSIPGARMYTPNIRFLYEDSVGGDPVKYPKYVDFALPTIKSTGLNGGELMESDYTSSQLYDYVTGKIPGIGAPVGFCGRTTIRIDFWVTAGTQDYSDFLQVSAPSTSVAQDKPVYTNIDGGYGIFACISKCRVKKQMANAWIDYISSHKPFCGPANLFFFNSASPHAQSTSCF